MIAMFFEDQKSRCLWKSCGEVFIWLISSMFWGQASAWAHTREGWPSSGSRIGFFLDRFEKWQGVTNWNLENRPCKISIRQFRRWGGIFSGKNLDSILSKIIKNDGFAVFWTWFFGATCLISYLYKRSLVVSLMFPPRHAATAVVHCRLGPVSWLEARNVASSVTF